MRVLLINPNMRRDFQAAPPIGLCYVASAADAAGHHVQVLDLCFKRRVMQEVDRSVRSFVPDVVGVSVRNVDNVNLLYPQMYLSETWNIISHVRKLTNVPIVVGGSGASLCPQPVLRYLGADYIVVSDGEESFVRLLDSIASGVPPENIPGVGMMSGGAFRLIPQSLNGFPNYNPSVGRWVDMQPYERYGACYTIQTKRGCPERCIYCTYGHVLEGTKLRLRSPESVLAEIDEVVSKYHPSSIEFVDAVFNHPQRYCETLLEGIGRLPRRCEFTAMGMRPVGLNSQFLDRLWKAGFKSFMMTPESASATMINNYGKRFSLDDLVNAAEALKRTRFTVMWYFLIGGPGETNDTLSETLDFVEKHLVLCKRPPWNLVHFYLGIRVYPGTPLWTRAVEDRLIHYDSDPLQQLWYMSQGLDLDLAVEQLTTLATKYPEISLGFDEKVLRWSGIVAPLARLFRLDRPYWRHLWSVNKQLLRVGARFRTHHGADVANSIRKQLQAQGYEGALIGGSPSSNREESEAVSLTNHPKHLGTNLNESPEHGRKAVQRY